MKARQDLFTCVNCIIKKFFSIGRGLYIGHIWLGLRTALAATQLETVPRRIPRACAFFRCLRA